MENRSGRCRCTQWLFGSATATLSLYPGRLRYSAASRDLLDAQRPSVEVSPLAAQNRSGAIPENSVQIAPWPGGCAQRTRKSPCFHPIICSSGCAVIQLCGYERQEAVASPVRHEARQSRVTAHSFSATTRLKAGGVPWRRKVASPTSRFKNGDAAPYSARPGDRAR